MDKEEKLYTHLGSYLGRAGKVMEKRINENFSMTEYPIRLEHWVVLVHLWLEDGQTQKDLCEYAGRNKTSITRTINSLEAQNFVVRIQDQHDRRNNRIYLTHKGKAAKEILTTQMFKTMDDAAEGITQEDLDTCKKVLNQVFLNLADEETLKIFNKKSYNRN